jgi:hypothetical protein
VSGNTSAALFGSQGDSSALYDSARARPPRRMHRLASTLLVLTMLTGLSVATAQRAQAAGTLTNISWAVSDNQAASTPVNYSYSFTTATADIIKTITFTVSGGVQTGTPVIVTNYGIGAGSVALAANVITYTVTAAVNIPAGIPIFIELSGLTNPAAGSYTEAIVTKLASTATIDSGTSPAVVFAAGNTAKTITVAESLVFTLDTAAFTFNMDPSLPALADQTHVSNITVLTNANSGYSLTVADNAAGLVCSCTGNPAIPDVSSSMATAVTFPGAPVSAAGYNVTGTGVGDAGFLVNADFSGSKYAGYRGPGDVVVTSSTPTGATANTIAITDETAIDYASPAGSYTDTITYTVTPNYS